MDIDALRRADRDASAAYWTLKQERSEKRRKQEAEALESIRAALALEYGERMKHLSQQRDEAARQLAEAEAEIGKADLANYPTGIVAEWGHFRHSYGRGAKRLTGKRGVFEVRMPDTQFAGNISSYRLPAIGQVFIRLLKKDGTPGLGFQVSQFGKFGNWLSEGESPKIEAT
jgi:hypothetical protein